MRQRGAFQSLDLGLVAALFAGWAYPSALRLGNPSGGAFEVPAADDALPEHVIASVEERDVLACPDWVGADALRLALRRGRLWLWKRSELETFADTAEAMS